MSAIDGKNGIVDFDRFIYTKYEVFWEKTSMSSREAEGFGFAPKDGGERVGPAHGQPARLASPHGLSRSSNPQPPRPRPMARKAEPSPGSEGPSWRWLMIGVFIGAGGTLLSSSLWLSDMGGMAVTTLEAKETQILAEDETAPINRLNLAEAAETNADSEASEVTATINQDTDAKPSPKSPLLAENDGERVLSAELLLGAPDLDQSGNAGRRGEPAPGLSDQEPKLPLATELGEAFKPTYKPSSSQTAALPREIARPIYSDSDRPAPAATAIDGDASIAPLPASSGREGTLGSRLYRVQLAAVDDETAAGVFWREVTARLPEVFKDVEPIFDSRTVAERNFMRIWVGSFDRHADADSYCGWLKGQGQDCFVTRVDNL